MKYSTVSDAILNEIPLLLSKVLFNVSVAMKGCGTVGGRKYVMLKPIGFNESTRVNILARCSCRCEDSIKHRRICSDETSLDATETSICKGSSCSSSGELSSEQCKMQKNQPVCSGQGDCINGQCVCHKTRLGMIYGKYCEKDDFSCPYHLGILCAGKF